jgi:hypothetical protein
MTKPTTEPHLLPESGNQGTMRLEVFATCEDADLVDGKLSLLHCFGRIHVPGVPFRVPEMVVVVRLRLEPSEVGTHHYGLCLVDPDGGAPVELGSGKFVAVPLADDRACLCNVIVRLQNVPLPQGGDYSLDFSLDGVLTGRLPLSVAVSQESD